MNPHSLIPHVDALYAARTRHEFPVSKEAAERSAASLRERLATRLVVERRTIATVTETSREESDLATFTQLDITLDDGVIVPVYVSTPRTEGLHKPIIMYHGHANGAQTLFGKGMTKEYQDCAIPFVEKGYYVIACDQRGFVERLGPSPTFYNGYTRSCRQVSFQLMMLGRTMLGERVSDGFALVDYLLTQKNLRHDSIVVTGNSGGGTTALFHAALDTRVKAAAIGSAFCEFKQSIMGLSHCECNYVPGIFQEVEEIWEVGALVAPRPMLIIHGREDKIFPISGVESSVAQVQNYYELYDMSRCLELQMHEGEHRYDHGRVFGFLTEHGYGTRI